MIYALIYLAFAVATLGHLSRTSQAFKPKYLAYAAGWPLYWVFFHGVHASLRILSEPLGETFFLYVALFTIGHFMARTTDNCSSLWSCGYLTLKTVAVFVGFPVYWGWVLAT